MKITESPVGDRTRTVNDKRVRLGNEEWCDKRPSKRGIVS